MLKKIIGMLSGEEPVWFRKAWKGMTVHVSDELLSPVTGVHSVPTDYAIGRLRGNNRQGAGAAYYWTCCRAATAGPTISIPFSICEPVLPQQSSGGGMGG